MKIPKGCQNYVFWSFHSCYLHRAQSLILQELGSIFIEAVISWIHSNLKVLFIYYQHHHGNQQEYTESHNTSGSLSDWFVTCEILLCEWQQKFAELIFKDCKILMTCPCFTSDYKICAPHHFNNLSINYNLCVRYIMMMFPAREQMSRSICTLEVERLANSHSSKCHLWWFQICY